MTAIRWTEDDIRKLARQDAETGRLTASSTLEAWRATGPDTAASIETVYDADAIYEEERDRLLAGDGPRSTREVDGRLSQRAQSRWSDALVIKEVTADGLERWLLERSDQDPVGLGRHYGEAVRALGTIIRAAAAARGMAVTTEEREPISNERAVEVLHERLHKIRGCEGVHLSYGMAGWKLVNTNIPAEHPAWVEGARILRDICDTYEFPWRERWLARTFGS